MKKHIYSLRMTLSLLIPILLFGWSSPSVAQTNQNAIQLDGLDDYVTFPDNDLLDLTTNYTLEAWVKFDSFSFLAGIISKYQTNAADGYTLRLSQYEPYRGINFDGFESIGLELEADKWYHIVAASSNGYKLLYVNGTRVFTSQNQQIWNASVNTDPLRIGSDYEGRFLNGVVDEVSIWNYAKSENEVSEGLFKVFQGSESGLVALWHLDEVSGVDAFDATTAALNNGTYEGDPSRIPPISGTQILEFGLNSQQPKGHLNLDTHQINLTVSNSTDVSSLIPTFIIPNGTTLKVDDVAQTSGTSIVDFTSPVIYQAIASDGITIEDWTVTVRKVPIISTFTPTSGEIGTPVTIEGTGFDPVSANNIVYFGATQATVTGGSSTELNVIVPIGATLEPISIVINGLICYSQLPFEVTFDKFGISENSFSWDLQFNGLTATSVAAADMDGDGQADIVVANKNSNTAAIYRNNNSTPGALSYDEKVDFYIGSSASPVFINTGDFDADGKPDVVTVNRNNHKFSVIRNSSTPGALSFDEYVTYPTKSTPEAVAVGDFDGDGKLDLAVANTNYAFLSVYRNTSSGEGVISFAEPTGLHETAKFITSADIDGDGKTDLVVVNYSLNTVSVFRNLSTSAGAIAFGARIDFNAGSNPVSVSVGDLNGDGKPDLAVANYGSSTVSVLQNISTGTGAVNFASKIDYVLNAAPSFVTIGNLDGDGKPDLVVTSNYVNINSVSILRNIGLQNAILAFDNPLLFNVGRGIASAAISDQDGNGQPEIIVANPSFALSVLSNNVVPSAESEILSFSLENQKETAVFGDGTIDITVGFGTDLMTLVPSFELSPGAYARIDCDIQITNESINDFTAPVIYSVIAQDGTSVMDWLITVTVSEKNNETELLTFSLEEQTGPAIISASLIEIEVEFGTDLTQLIAEFTLSFRTQALVNAALQISGSTSNDFSNPVTYTLLAEDGINSQNWTVQVTTAPNDEVDIIEFGFSEQTKPAVINRSNHSIEIEVAYGTDLSILTPTFTLSANANVTVNAITQESGVTVNDFSNLVTYLVTAEDGITNQAWAIYVRIAPPKIMSFSPMNGPVGTEVTITGGTFDLSLTENVVFFGATKAVVTAVTENELTVNVPFGASYAPISVTVGDLSGHSQFPFSVTFDGTAPKSDSFGLGVNMTPNSTYAYPYKTAAGDLDGDGLADIVTICNDVNNDLVTIFRNESTAPGSMAFSSRMEFGKSRGAGELALSDLDGDGLLDVVAVNNQWSTISVLRNTSTGQGNINLANKLDFTTGSYPTSVVIGDFNMDGKPDLAVSNTGSSSISIFKNTSTGPGNISFADKLDFGSNPIPLSLSAADLNGDQMIDLVATNLSGTVISVFQNISSGNINFSKSDVEIGLISDAITTDDIDNDGKIDLAIISKDDGVLTILRNTSEQAGPLTFADKIVLATIAGPNAIAIGAIDGDGKADLVIAHYDLGTVSVFPNESTPENISYGPKINYFIGIKTWDASIADLDNNGQSDLILTHWTTSKKVHVVSNLIIPPNHDADFLSFSFAEQTKAPTIDLPNHTISIEVDRGTDLSALVASFTLSPFASITMGAEVQVSGSTVNDFTSPITYQITAEDGTLQSWTITVSHAPNTETAISAFSFTEQLSAATIGAGTIAIEVNYHANITSLIPTISLSENATINPASGAARNFTNPVTYIVTAEDGITTQSWLVTVTKEIILTIGKSKGFSAYPNPVHQELTISLIEFPNQMATIIITDISGKEIERRMVEGRTQEVFNVQSYESGVYIIGIKQGEKQFYSRFIKE